MFRMALKAKAEAKAAVLKVKVDPIKVVAKVAKYIVTAPTPNVQNMTPERPRFILATISRRSANVVYTICTSAGL